MADYTLAEVLEDAAYGYARAAFDDGVRWRRLGVEPDWNALYREGYERARAVFVWQYRARWPRESSEWFPVAPDRVAEWQAVGYLVERRPAGPWMPVNEEEE